MNNYIALIITFAASLLFLRSMDFIAHRGWMDGKLSRKVIHIGTGPLFVLCWFLFNDAPEARWLAALVPFAVTAQFALIGLGVLKDEASVQAMSRTGDPKEILRGPLYYGIMFVALTLIYWRENPIGIIALMMLCGGDGMIPKRGGIHRNHIALELGQVGRRGHGFAEIHIFFTIDTQHADHDQAEDREFVPQQPFPGVTPK